jgi:CRP-like cAMP-binding protein
MVCLSEGHTVEVATIGHDSVFGAAATLDGGISLTSAVVVLPGTAFVLDAADFRATFGRSVVFRATVARHEQALPAMAQQSAACNASHSVEARLSCWLLRACDLSGGRTLPLTQESLAQLIGVQRNAISIVAHALNRLE